MGADRGEARVIVKNFPAVPADDVFLVNAQDKRSLLIAGCNDPVLIDGDEPAGKMLRLRYGW
ncbi:MAG: hypothetical protein ACD_75C01463G0006 [uncultured bacterium]|nr:MAG: hypothetical protein ACD_75C01463G0006 [uncultured bacterium]